MGLFNIISKKKRASLDDSSKNAEGQGVMSPVPSSASLIRRLIVAAEAKRILASDWPAFELVDPDFLHWDDSTDFITVDTSIWKTAPTNNEAPPIYSKRDVTKHKRSIDAWLALKGLVFDVTTFIDFHPGGADELWKGVGRDATDLFTDVHPEVNIRQYIGKFCVGVYIPNPKSTKRIKMVPENQEELEGNEEEQSCWANLFGFRQTNPEGRFEIEFSQNDSFVILVIKAPPALANFVLGHECWTVLLWDADMLFIKVLWHISKCFVAQFRLTEIPDCENFYINFQGKNQATIILPKADNKHWETFGKAEAEGPNCVVVDPAICSFDDATRALLFYRCQIAKHGIIYGIKIRPSSFYGLPLGSSILLTVNDLSVRIYPTTFTLLDVVEPTCEIKGQTLYFLIPQDFIVAEILNSLGSMNDQEMLYSAYVSVSDPRLEMDKDFLETSDTLILLVHGTGIAPIASILRHFQEKHPEHAKKYNILLLYFNDSAADIIWREELTEAAERYPWFHLFLAVETPNKKWDQLIGTISTHLVTWCVKSVPNACSESRNVNGLASGSQDFLDKCTRIFQNMHDTFEHVVLLPPAREEETALSEP